MANPKSKHACIVEPHESTKRLERTLSKDHGDRIAGKGFNSLSHKHLVKKFIPMRFLSGSTKKSDEQSMLLR